MATHEPTQKILILMAGMPGAGKSTVALALGRAFGLPVIDKDVIVSTLLDQGLAEHKAHPVAYQTMFDLVEQLVLRQALSVAIDSPAADPSVLEWALNLSVESGARLIPVLCSADGETRYDRMAARQGLRSHSKGTARKPGTDRERFNHFPADTIDLDTMGPVDQVIERAVQQVERRIIHLSDSAKQR